MRVHSASRAGAADGPRLLHAEMQRRRAGGPGKSARVTRVPVLPRTVLGLELLLAAGPLDLRAAGALLREDPGALLQLFRLLAEEYPEVETRPKRLEEWVAGLPMRRLLRRLAKASVAAGEPGRMEAFARHAAEIGRGAESVAETLGIGREQAWAVGMLHELGRLPRLAPRVLPGETTHWCAELARQYRLPSALCAALEEVHRESAGSVWWAVVAAAHDLERATEAC